MECFAVYSNNLEGRLDCFYYKPDNRTIINSKYPIKNIEDITLKIIHPPEYKRIYSNKGYQLLRAQNVKPFKIIIDANKVFFSKESLPSENLIFPEIGDVLVVRSGVNTGDCAVIDERYDDLILGSDNLVCKCKNEIRPKYLMIFLCSDFGKKLLAKYITGATNSHITPQNLGKIKLPIPFIENQDSLVQLMGQAYSLKESKEAEAQRLLDSINDYVLDELGIKLPELRKHLSHLVFSDEAKGERLDPRYYKPYFKEFEEELTKRKDIKIIGEISEYVGSGATPKAGGDDYTSSDEGILFIRIVNLKNNTIVLDDVLYIRKTIHEGMLKRTKLKVNDVLLSMAGTIGLSVVVPENLGEANINQAIARIVVNRNINPFYLSALLNSKIGKIQTDRLSRPAVQANINLAEIRALKIPLPPLPIQNKIAEEVKSRMKKADQLQKQAKEELEKAKQEVEKIILGDR